MYVHHISFPRYNLQQHFRKAPNLGKRAIQWSGSHPYDARVSVVGHHPMCTQIIVDFYRSFVLREKEGELRTPLHWIPGRQNS